MKEKQINQVFTYNLIDKNIEYNLKSRIKKRHIIRYTVEMAYHENCQYEKSVNLK